MFIWATSRRKFNLWWGKVPLARACSMFKQSGGFIIAFAKAPSPSHLTTYPATSADPTTPATKAPTATSTPASPTCPTSTLDSPRAVNHHRCPNPAALGLRHTDFTATSAPAPPHLPPSTLTPPPQHRRDTTQPYRLATTTTSTALRHRHQDAGYPASCQAHCRCPSCCRAGPKISTTPPTVLSHHQPPPRPPRLNAATPAVPSSPQRRHHIPTPLRHPGRTTTPAIATPTTATTSVAPEPSGYYHH
ncbi:hypothetical protein EDB89DRAFT_1903383 [Lactarius sanguifluus]|nr:hypothetical protein EDB89DRAFT_1903383 [Lactarius sanguifluus]